ncbi:DUF192 domain-containing protein [Candidatus Collierbacteria bacterium]|nr:DUF192 domain-containing protein [Candidatus Collierbacteria bacterium]
MPHSKANYIHKKSFSKKFIQLKSKPANDKQVGLAKYSSLKQNQGMLFRYPTKGNYQFWMKDMKFDIDIVWITDNKVMGINRGEFKDPLKLIDPPVLVDTIIEVNPNSGIQVGDLVSFR